MTLHIDDSHPLLSPRMRLRLMRSTLVALLVMCLPYVTRLDAQMVEAGIARDAKLKTPLECLHVALVDSGGRAVAHTVTDSAGQFLLEAPRPGVYRVQFLAYRWEPLMGPLDTLTEGMTKQRAFPIAFTNMLVPDSSYGSSPNTSAGREVRERYRNMEALLRDGESDSTWRSRRSIPSDIGIRYPDRLRAAGVDGTVLARFIVDSTGRARSNSWVTIQATHADFADAVRGSLDRARWTPAKLAGRPVCELTYDYIRFHRSEPMAGIVFITR